MQNLIITKPYQFVPPYRGEFWCWILGFYLNRFLRKTYGIVSHSVQDLHLMRASIEAGHGILVTPNHCRDSDPLVMGILVNALNRPFYHMGSRHLFEESRFKRWILRRIGAFSVFREITDREALRAAIGFLTEARRPVVVFPEGMITRANDRLAPLQDGVAFMARTAAKKRAEAAMPGKVVVHPVRLRYTLRCDVNDVVLPMLRDIEKRFTWQPQENLPLKERICIIGEGMLALKEIEYLHVVQSGSIESRIDHLIEHLIGSLEKQWFGKSTDAVLIERVKKLRQTIVPDMLGGKLDAQETARRWKHLAEVYLAVQLSCYPPGYLDGDPSKERILETVERFEEDLTDKLRINQPIHVDLRVGPAIEVNPVRERRAEGDPLIKQIETQLLTMLAEDAAKRATP